jgi:hypothetical protein
VRAHSLGTLPDGHDKPTIQACGSSNVHHILHRILVYDDPVAKRLSVILGDDDERTLEPFTDPSSDHHQVLQRWAAAHQLGSVTSEAAAIRALLQVGAEALRDEVLDQGYAELAIYYDGPESHDDRRAARERYIARTEADL